MNGHTDILAIESSCDETAAAVIRDGREVLSNIIYTQIKLHTVYGGVVPEIASRKHIEKMNYVVQRALDKAGMKNKIIFSYAVKYASAFYGPFRDAAGSAPSFGDRRAYQMDPRNVREGLKEAEIDIEEGADLVMVKPGLLYMDVLRAVKEISPVPVGTYCVSGEYAMIKAAAANGWIDEQRAVSEAAFSLARAGADVIITYSALDLAKWLRDGKIIF